MNRSLTCIFFLLSATLAPALCEAAGPDRSAISAVIESFRTAILQRDKPRFLGLFVTPDLPWQSVKSDDSLVQTRGQDALPSKLRFDPKNNPTSFIDFVVSSKATSEETFSNVVIDGDDDVATVAFDYTFLSDGHPTNSGKECWLLVRSETGGRSRRLPGPSGWHRSIAKNDSWRKAASSRLWGVSANCQPKDQSPLTCLLDEQRAT